MRTHQKSIRSEDTHRKTNNIFYDASHIYTYMQYSYRVVHIVQRCNKKIATKAHVTNRVQCDDPAV